jgi:AhpD family alkylhydroperoxidase
MSMNGSYPEYYKQLLNQMGNLGKAAPETMAAFSALHKASGSDGSLNAKVKELMALSIAVVVRCDGCIAFHVNDALKAGATREEIIDALGVAILMGGGPAVMYACAAMEALEQFEGEPA